MSKLLNISHNGNLKDGTIVTFSFNDGTVIRGVVWEGDSKKDVFIHIYGSYLNDIIFKKIGIENVRGFVSYVVGYDCRDGAWPQVKSMDDLEKVLSALCNYSKGSYLINIDNKSTNTSNIITIRKPKKINLNFEL